MSFHYLPGMEKLTHVNYKRAVIIEDGKELSIIRSKGRIVFHQRLRQKQKMTLKAIQSETSSCNNIYRFLSLLPTPDTQKSWREVGGHTEVTITYDPANVGATAEDPAPPAGPSTKGPGKPKARRRQQTAVPRPLMEIRVSPRKPSARMQRLPLERKQHRKASRK